MPKWTDYLPIVTRNGQRSDSQAGNGSRPGSMTSGPGSTGSRVGTGDTPGGPFSGSGSGSGNLGSGSFGGSLTNKDGIGAGRRLSSSGSVSPRPDKGGPGNRSDCSSGVLIVPSPPSAVKVVRPRYRPAGTILANAAELFCSALPRPDTIASLP